MNTRVFTQTLNVEKARAQLIAHPAVDPSKRMEKDVAKNKSSMDTQIFNQSNRKEMTLISSM
jgi:hypothetical protein